MAWGKSLVDDRISVDSVHKFDMDVGHRCGKRQSISVIGPLWEIYSKNSFELNIQSAIQVNTIIETC